MISAGDFFEGTVSHPMDDGNYQTFGASRKDGVFLLILISYLHISDSGITLVPRSVDGGMSTTIALSFVRSMSL